MEGEKEESDDRRKGGRQWGDEYDQMETMGEEEGMEVKKEESEGLNARTGVRKEVGCVDKEKEWRRWVNG